MRLRSLAMGSRTPVIALGVNIAFLLVAFLQPTHWLLLILAVPTVFILPGSPIIRAVLQNLHPIERGIAVVLASLALSTTSTLMVIRVVGPVTPRELALALVTMNLAAYAISTTWRHISARRAT